MAAIQWTEFTLEQEDELVEMHRDQIDEGKVVLTYDEDRGVWGVEHR